ncbi:MAG: hypothetical protein HFF96_11100 [Oscillibacter sp.]|uniref:hypothetical protein n=1 Tax=Oscillibacter sp. TaxID=1945593 RepID=UPI002171BE6A|nr:hypothetical protein [Oscillibacter sp.]MCI9114779.1 hypothetical protein [Oscillibacter sp.]
MRAFFWIRGRLFFTFAFTFAFAFDISAAGTSVSIGTTIFRRRCHLLRRRRHNGQACQQAERHQQS